MSKEDADPLGAVPGVGRTINAFKELIVRDVMIRMRTGMPAEVVSWAGPVAAGPKSKPALVRVRPHFYTVVSMNSRDECTTELEAAGWVASIEGEGWIRKKPLPEIPNCPVAYVGPAGMLARGPLKAGETGWLVFSDRSLDKWTQTGGPVDPVFQDFHLLNDAVFFPGLRYGTNAKAISSDYFAIGPEDGSAGMFIDNVTAPALPDIEVSTTGANATIDALTAVNLGAAATLGVARQTDPVSPNAAFTAFMSQIVAAFTVINAIIPVTIPTPPVGAFGTITGASTKVKAE
jgi:hypothetical protein